VLRGPSYVQREEAILKLYKDMGTGFFLYLCTYPFALVHLYTVYKYILYTYIHIYTYTYI
jgi:hypothetical protein